jgi:hypothetical protein
MSNYLTPMLLTIGISEGNHFYNTGALDIKILVFGGMATGILALLSNIPGLEPVMAGLAWVAFAASLVAPIQSPSPVQNILKITGT